MGIRERRLRGTSTGAGTRAAVRGTNTWSRNRNGSATSAAIAFHRSLRLAAFGPMGVTCTLAGKYGNRKNLQQLFERTITHLLS